MSRDGGAKPGRVRLLVIICALFGLLVLGCGRDDKQTSGDRDDESPPSEPVTSTEASDPPTEEVVLGEGSLFADPGAIRDFPDPAGQIRAEVDLVQYLLPGLTGSGADCLESRLDLDDTLSGSSSSPAGVADSVQACVAPDEIGKIFGMYAVGFEEDGTSRYADLAACVTDEFGAQEPTEVGDALTAVYVERLDLAGPPTSREVAADEIERLTNCSTEVTAAPAPTREPRYERSVAWNLLQPGDCLVDLPSGTVVNVTVVDCRTRHRLEVVGATFSSGGQDPGTQCENLYTNYTGRPFEQSDHRLEYLQSEAGGLSARLVCLATNAARSPTTGSIR